MVAAPHLYAAMIDDDFLDALDSSSNEDGDLSQDAEDKLRDMDHSSARAQYWAKVQQFQKFKDALEVKDDE